MWAFLGEILEGAEPNTGSTVQPPSGGGVSVPGSPGSQGPQRPSGADGSSGVTMEEVNAAIQQAVAGAIEEAY